MCLHFFLRILDNSTVAGILVIVIGGLVGERIYRNQKNIDRQFNAGDKLAEALVLLEEHSKSVNLIFSRIANTYNDLIRNANEAEQAKFFNKALPDETAILGNILMDSIPQVISKVESIISLYFDNHKKIKSDWDKLSNNFGEWYAFAVNYPIGQTERKHDISKHASDIPELSLTVIHDSIKSIIKDLR